MPRPRAPATPEPLPAASLSERLAEQTRQWIIAAAADLLEEQGPASLTNAALAARAGIAERTVYRHFATRDALLGELAAEVTRRLATPPVPSTPAALLQYPAQLFACFEARPNLTRAALGSELFQHMRDSTAAQRWAGVQRLLDDHLPDQPASARAMAAANIRFLLSATTWHYYRQHFGFDAGQATRCVQHALQLQLQALGLLTRKDHDAAAAAAKPRRERRERSQRRE